MFRRRLNAVHEPKNAMHKLSWVSAPPQIERLPVVAGLFAPSAGHG
jgi:hypothetical protein